MKRRIRIPRRDLHLVGSTDNVRDATQRIESAAKAGRARQAMIQDLIKPLSFEVLSGLGTVIIKFDRPIETMSLLPSKCRHLAAVLCEAADNEEKLAAKIAAENPTEDPQPTSTPTSTP